MPDPDQPPAPESSSQSAPSSRWKRWWKGWVGDEEDLGNLRWRRKNMRAFQFGFLLATTGVPLLAAIWFLWIERPVEPEAIAIFAYFQCFFLAGFFTCRAQGRDLAAEYRTRKFENQILRNRPEDKPGEETDSMILFLKNEVELKRYYDQALRQSSFVYVLGVVCVLAGLAAVGAAGAVVYSIANGEDVHETAQIVIGSLGVAGGLLSGYVARVYLGMQKGTVSSMTDFHTRFVLTHHVLFSNALVARIGDQELRDDALGSMARAIASDGSIEKLGASAR